MNKLKISYILNILIVLLVSIGSIFMFTGIKFMPDTLLLADTKINMFKYYTVDSNILVGVVSLILVIYEFMFFMNKISDIPKWVYVLKFIGTSSIALTFITTLVFLAPKLGFYALYNNSNLFFHLIVPLLSFVSYIFFEKYESNYKESILGIVLMLIYAFYYITNVFTHLNNGGPTIKYDFYGFLFGNINNTFIVVPVIIIVTYLMSLLLLFLNNYFNRD